LNNNIKIEFTEMACEDVSWFEGTEIYVEWYGLVLALFSPRERERERTTITSADMRFEILW
jgi:hypothetical protein